jgi:hypothetical protein
MRPQKFVDQPKDGECNTTPEAHHTIGRTENFPEDLGPFIQKHSGDPAIDVRPLTIPSPPLQSSEQLQGFIPRLKQHLLPRIRASLAKANGWEVDGNCPATLLNPDEPLGDWRAVVLKLDRFYKHNTMHINYTTYDVRRGEDVIHVGTSRCDIMVLNPAFAEDANEHPFCYAHVLGIFHANVVYLGEQNLDYRPWRLEFLWVRWYGIERGVRSGWKALKLDRVRFPHMADSLDAFGFLDPIDVLRGCHVVPAFSRGRVHPDGKSFSNLAQDKNNWSMYYINRYADAVKSRSQWHSHIPLVLWTVTW